MPLDCDVAVIGTGVAPLVAASHLGSLGRSVLLLNPGFDFFLENSELPLDPLSRPERLNPQSLARSRPENVFEALRPFFPGAVEDWPREKRGKGQYHDPQAPHVRSRDRLWVIPRKTQAYEGWERFEDLYVAASDSDLDPRIVDGVSAKKRFPGFSRIELSREDEDVRGFRLPRLCDVDVSRYRVGLLEFVRERLGEDRVLCDVTQLEVTAEGVRFRAKGSTSSARVREGIMVFWTPGTNSWIEAQVEKFDLPLPDDRRPLGARLYEQWTLLSREILDPSTVGVFGDRVVWAEIEGSPEISAQALDRLAVLRTGPLVPLASLGLSGEDAGWVGSDSLGALSELCRGFLRWDRFSMRSLLTRAILEWPETGEESWAGYPAPRPLVLSGGFPDVHLVSGADGFLADVVRQARSACDALVRGVDSATAEATGEEIWT